MDERIKELAEQAGAGNLGLEELDKYIDLERFAELVRQDEREACAKVAEESYSRQIIHYPKGYYVDPNRLGEYSEEIVSRCAAAIRGRTK